MMFNKNSIQSLKERYPEGTRIELISKNDPLAPVPSGTKGTVQRQQQAEKPAVGRVSFASGEEITYANPEEYLKAIREELPYHATSGFRYQTFTDDPQVRKAVDDEIYNLFGEKNPRSLEEYETPPSQGMNFGGM